VKNSRSTRVPCAPSGISIVIYDHLAVPRPDELAFVLIFALAMSTTALPVLARILAELGMMQSRSGAIAIAVAAINDIVGWGLLGAIMLLVSGQLSGAWIGSRVLALAAAILVAWYLARPALHRYFDRHIAANGRLRHTAISVVLVTAFSAALGTMHLGLHALIGAFLIGVALHQHENLKQEWKTRVGPVVNTLFLPIFFAFTGLRTNLGSIDSADAALQCVVICVLSFVLKYGSAFLGARFAGEDSRTSHVLAACMNTRGLMELVVLNIGYELGLLSPTLFTQLVYMAVLMTILTSVLLRRFDVVRPASD